ncbi:MAG: SRPBCC domain-containing protein [Gammaproteobacteria bacterium]|nr:SRPBCC domain-containing protein [Gammaproteobacteria bacterium]MDH5730566.1 SRPBCC domain-containing protein [Gammaproteobacteria bacterium]
MFEERNFEKFEVKGKSMKQFEAKTTIEAKPEDVWKVLVDVKSWPTWDKYCEKIEGEVALGKKVTAFTKLAPGRGFKVKVSELQENKYMVWSGGMPFGLFVGKREWILKSLGESKVEFTTRETFTGPLVKLFAAKLPDLSEPFQAFVSGLKNKVEKK